MMRDTTDLFGNALLAHFQGDRTAFEFMNSEGVCYRHSLERYFRTRSQLSELELNLIGLCNGDIFDVGCATGYYIPALMERGTVTAIDVSPGALCIARIWGLTNCRMANFFTFDPRQRFDTITLLENNLGMAGTVQRAKHMLTRLTKMLREDGQILIVARDVRQTDYIELSLTPRWKGETGKPFKWMSFNIRYLKHLCSGLGLKMQLLDVSASANYLARLTREDPQEPF